MPEVTKMPDAMWNEIPDDPEPKAAASRQRRTKPAQPKPEKAAKPVRDHVLQLRLTREEVRTFNVEASHAEMTLSEFGSMLLATYVEQNRREK